MFTEGATPVPAGPLYLGFTSLAVDDAVRTASGQPQVSAAAAAAVAAHDVLVAYFPASDTTCVLLANHDCDVWALQDDLDGILLADS